MVRIKFNFKFKYCNFLLDFVQPICLPISNLHPARAGDSMFVAGFGRTLTSRASQVKQKLKVPVFDQNECVKKFASKNVEINHDQICAGGRKYFKLFSNR